MSTKRATKQRVEDVWARGLMLRGCQMFGCVSISCRNSYFRLCFVETKTRSLPPRSQLHFFHFLPKPQHRPLQSRPIHFPSLLHITIRRRSYGADFGIVRLLDCLVVQPIICLVYLLFLLLIGNELCCMSNAAGFPPGIRSMLVRSSSITVARAPLV